MSNQPPSNMPEMSRDASTRNKRKAPADDYVLVPLDDDNPSGRTVSTGGNSERGGLRGCMMGLAGAMGCLFLMVMLLGGAVLVTGATVAGMANNIFGTLSGFWQNTQGVFVPDDIYIPEVERIQALSELSTVRFNYTGTVAAETDMPDLIGRLYGSEQILVAVGSVRAGIDISQITGDDIRYNATDNVLTVQLPPPRLQDCFLNDNETYVAERNSALFAPDAPQLDTAARRSAIENFRRLAMEDGILQEAASRAETTVQEFLQIAVPDAEIRVITAPVDPDAPLPDSCR